MSAPSISAIFPNDGATGIPAGATIQITFDQGVDPKSIGECIVVYGPDSDMTSGPESATWIDRDTGDNPFFLSSPGFTGAVDCDVDIIYVDSTGTEISGAEYLTAADETAAGAVSKVIITPKSLMQSEVIYYVYLLGDSEDGTDRGIKHRTVFDVDSSAATSADASVYVYGGYTGEFDDILYVEVTSSGNIGAAKYKWWLDSAGSGSATTGKSTSRRFRHIDQELGLQIRFSGSGFVAGDVYAVSLRTPAVMEDSYSFSFTIGEGTILSVPSTASTSAIGSTTALTSAATNLEILEMDPPNGSTHQRFKHRKITIKFSEELDPTTVTQDTVTVLAYPVSGKFDSSLSNSSEQVELAKKLTVADDTLTIEV
jgi:hypothetical protein